MCPKNVQRTGFWWLKMTWILDRVHLWIGEQEPGFYQILCYPGTPCFQLQVDFKQKKGLLAWCKIDYITFSFNNHAQKQLGCMASFLSYKPDMEPLLTLFLFTHDFEMTHSKPISRVDVSNSTGCSRRT